MKNLCILFAFLVLFALFYLWISLSSTASLANVNANGHANDPPSENIHLPVVFHLVQSDNPQYNAMATPEQLTQELSIANQIFAPAGIQFDLKQINQVWISSSLIDAVTHPKSHLASSLENLPQYDFRAINGFFVGKLLQPSSRGHDLHGKEFEPQHLFFISDSVSDPPESRTLAHELSHVVGLSDLHGEEASNQPGNLLSTGRQGNSLTPEQVTIAHNTAQRIQNHLS